MYDLAHLLMTVIIQFKHSCFQSIRKTLGLFVLQATLGEQRKKKHLHISSGFELPMARVGGGGRCQG